MIVMKAIIREFYEKIGTTTRTYWTVSRWSMTTKVNNNKWVPKKDAVMKEYFEKNCGGKVNSWKQVLIKWSKSP